VRNGPDLKELSSSADTKQDLRKDGKKIIGYVGVTGIQDGVDNLVKAIHYLVQNLGRTDILCIILGDGNAMPSLKSLAAKLNITPYILFSGWINRPEEIAEYFKVMDVCVAPEPSDPYNNCSTAAKVMEYMAMGKPVVSSDLPEHRFTARDAAIYAMPGDEQDLANKIAELIDNPKQRITMGKTGQARVQTELAWPHQAKKLIEAYQKLAFAS
jgi:glycosyltransferase involved in cell wall biosynthesis